MKKYLITVIAAVAMLLGGSYTSRAQFPEFNPDEMVKMIVDQMKESLKINDEQATKLLDLFKKEMEEMSKMFEGGGMPDMGKMQENQKKQDEAIQKILTEDQYKAYAEQQRKMMEQFGGGF